MRRVYMAGQIVTVDDSEWIGNDGRFYNIINGVGTKKTPTETAIIMEAEITAKTNEQERINDINAAIEVAGLREVTISQAENYIASTLDAASTAAEIKEAIRVILKRMIPYIL